MADLEKAEEATRVMLIRPGDVLIISGFHGEFDKSVSDAFGALTQAGIAHVIAFRDEVDLSKLEPDHLRRMLAELEAAPQECSAPPANERLDVRPTTTRVGGDRV